jgi:hypothetical protein
MHPGRRRSRLLASVGSAPYLQKLCPHAILNPVNGTEDIMVSDAIMDRRYVASIIVGYHMNTWRDVTMFQ